MPPIFHKHPRLRGRDYTRGTFFITISTARRGDILGRIVGPGAEARMELNEVGRIVDACFNAIPKHHPQARIAEMQLMPDHLHAILVLEPKERTGWEAGAEARGEERSKSTQWVDGTGTQEAIVGGDGNAGEGRPKGPKRGSLGAIVAVFKSESTKRINALLGIPGRQFWKKGYHEHVVREHGGEYGRIAQYIAENPRKWK